MADTVRPERRKRAVRLLCLIDSLAGGGAESLLLPYASGLDPARVDLRVCCLKAIGGNPFEQELRRNGIRVTNLEARSLRDVSAFRRLLRLLHDSSIDLIHAHLTYAGIWGAIASAWTRVPCVATVHVIPQPISWRTRDGVRHLLLYRLLDRYAAAVVAVSDPVRHALLHRAGLDPWKVVVVHNGIDCDLFAPGSGHEREAIRGALDLPLHARVALVVAALRNDKGLDVLLDAVPRILASTPDARFLVAGEGPLEGPLRARTEALGVGGRCRWLGFRQDLAALYRAADLFVLPSRDDALPTALLEAMAVGLPIVATRVGGIPEIVDTASGRLVDPDDPVALADAVIGLLADPDGRAAMSRDARSRACAEFSNRVWWSRLERLYEHALGQTS